MSDRDDYARARARVIAAQAALAEAFHRHDMTPCAPPIAELGGEADPDDVTQARADVADAEAEMRTVSERLSDEIEAAHDALRQAVQDARAEVDAALRHRIDIEAAVAAAATRERRYFTPDEAERCRRAREAWLAAKQQADEAGARFKAGVGEV